MEKSKVISHLEEIVREGEIARYTDADLRSFANFIERAAGELDVFGSMKHEMWQNARDLLVVLNGGETEASRNILERDLFEDANSALRTLKKDQARLDEKEGT